MFREAQWLKYKTVPTIDEYMTNGYVSFALGPIVLPALYLVGPKLSEDVTGHPEFHNLYKLMSTTGRLLNDIHSFKVNMDFFFPESLRNLSQKKKKGKITSFPSVDFFFFLTQ